MNRRGNRKGQLRYYIRAALRERSGQRWNRFWSARWFWSAGRFGSVPIGYDASYWDNRIPVVVTVSGGVAEIFQGDALIIDFDEWDDIDVNEIDRQDMVEAAIAAGLRVIVYGAPGERPNIQLFKPDQDYAGFINNSIRDDEVFVVYDPNKPIVFGEDWLSNMGRIEVR